MKISNNLQTYYSLFSLISEDFRIMPKRIAKRLKYSGTGKSPSTLLYHISRMYELGISKEPRLFLKSFSETYPSAFFCRKESLRGLYSTLCVIDSDPSVSYAVCLSSKDFFLMSRNKDLKVERYGLTLLEKSVIYTPVFTIPKSCKLDTNAAFQAIPNNSFRKGFLNRELLKGFDWAELDWNIYSIMGSNVRAKYSHVAKKCDTTPTTTKKHFLEKVVPRCVQVHYFFPKGFSNYSQAFLRVFSGYEKSLIESLPNLPCTSYVYPLEEGLILVLFHESTEVLLESFEKLEEMAIIDGYLLFNPIAHSVSD